MVRKIQAKLVLRLHAQGLSGRAIARSQGMSLLTISDVMSTGYHAAASAEVKPGDTAVAKAEQQRLRDGAFFRAKQKALEQKAKALFEHTGGKADEHHSQNRMQRAEHGKPHAVIQQPQQRDTQQRL